MRTSSFVLASVFLSVACKARDYNAGNAAAAKSQEEIVDELANKALKISEAEYQKAFEIAAEPGARLTDNGFNLNVYRCGYGILKARGGDGAGAWYVDPTNEAKDGTRSISNLLCKNFSTDRVFEMNISGKGFGSLNSDYSAFVLSCAFIPESELLRTTMVGVEASVGILNSVTGVKFKPVSDAPKKANEKPVPKSGGCLMFGAGLGAGVSLSAVTMTLRPRGQ